MDHIILVGLQKSYLQIKIKDNMKKFFLILLAGILTIELTAQNSGKIVQIHYNYPVKGYNIDRTDTMYMCWDRDVIMSKTVFSNTNSIDYAYKTGENATCVFPSLDTKESDFMRLNLDNKVNHSLKYSKRQKYIAGVLAKRAKLIIHTDKKYVYDVYVAENDYPQALNYMFMLPTVTGKMIMEVNKGRKCLFTTIFYDSKVTLPNEILNLCAQQSINPRQIEEEVLK